MRKRILVVAHKPEVIESIPITLEMAGHKVAIADSGLDAILWAERLSPDLIVVDDSLPDMDGATVVGILRRLSSTASLGTILLKPRWPVVSREVPVARGSLDPRNSSELLMQVARALSLCQTHRHPR